jgi:hypothetical protein
MIVDPTSNRLSCSEANQYFFPLSYPQNKQLNIIQQVWDALASVDNLDFIAMSSYINQAKAALFNPPGEYMMFINDPRWLIPSDGNGWEWPNTRSNLWSAFDALSKIFRHLEFTLYGLLEMGTDNMLDLIDRTNSRIYAALSVCVNIILRELIANDSQPKCRQYDRCRLDW